jgi:hypothetical protein
VVVLFLVLTTIAALLPSEVRISRAIDINRPLDEIYPSIADIRAWENWNLFVQKQEGKQWTNREVVGKTLSISIKEQTEKAVVTQWKQTNGKTFTGGFNLIANDSLTTVQWYFDFRFKWYPWEKFSSIVYDAQVGPPMEESLMNLKNEIEQGR